MSFLKFQMLLSQSCIGRKADPRYGSPSFASVLAQAKPSLSGLDDFSWASLMRGWKISSSESLQGVIKASSSQPGSLPSFPTCRCFWRFLVCVLNLVTPLLHPGEPTTWEQPSASASGKANRMGQEHNLEELGGRGCRWRWLPTRFLPFVENRFVSQLGGNRILYHID